MKATLVLLPLLGITYMLFFVNPGEDEVSRVVFIYFNSFLESFQVQPSPTPAPRSSPDCPLHLFGWELFQAGAWRSGRLGTERGQPQSWMGPHLPPSLDPPSPSTPGFLRICVLLLPQQRGKDLGPQDSGRQEPCWDQRLSVASSCPRWQAHFFALIGSTCGSQKPGLQSHQ